MEWCGLDLKRADYICLGRNGKLITMKITALEKMGLMRGCEGGRLLSLG
jgi:hypothetical protein